MKIDFSIDSLIGGGAERVMVTIADALAKNHEVRLITFNDGDKYTVSNSVERIRLHEKCIKNHTIRSAYNLYRFYRNQKTKPDVLISFMPTNGFIAIIVGILLNFNVIVSEHINHSFKQKNRKTLFIRKYFYKFANFITVLTSYDVEYYTKMGAKVVVMPNPISVPDRTKPFEKREKTILLVGSLDRYHQKGFDAFLPTVAPILKEHPDWTLRILGGGSTGLPYLQDIARGLGIENHIKFEGFCPNVYEIMQNSQIFVLPSRFEGLPMGLMEAMSNGMACIAYDCITGPSELIEHRENGLLVENQNEVEMQEQLKLLLDNGELKKQLSEKAHRSMLKFTLPEITQKWEALFEQTKPF
ncbi:glycosyltransferase family 4 protein [Flagellimonas marinaquae]|jgi:GalNAc-alpha-(1->4)-GalNAc-alpha-(1->3)-diNAcBac-PP-undecaprenol alpha-1,4-N-acetyl-D-galactosaminyltransferase